MCHRAFNKKQSLLEIRNDKFKVERFKFYRHLKSYLVVNLIFASVALINNDSFTFGPFAFLWGLAVLSHYKKVFYTRRRKTYGYHSQTDIVEIVEEPNWKDEDLV